MNNYPKMNSRGELVYLEDDVEYVLDELGNKRPPMQLTRSKKTSGFTHYEIKHGHCGLCGRLDCLGNCFK